MVFCFCLQPRKSGLAAISVRDIGLGILKETENKIFKTFFTTKSTGQGLGLAVCRRLVEAHEGGSIIYSSDVGKGSKFTVEVPFKIRRPKGGDN